MNEPAGHLSDPLCRTELVKRPDRIESRRDAFALWLHLLERGIAFRCDEDPAEWGLPMREVATMRRLFAEVDRLGSETFDCYADAESLRNLVMLGARPTESQQRVPELRRAA